MMGEMVQWMPWMWLQWLAAEMVYASLVCLVVWVISSLWRSAPAKVQYGLWSLVLLRLVLPVDLATPWSLASWASVAVPEVSGLAVLPLTQETPAQEPTALAVPAVASLSGQVGWLAAGLLWLFCAAALATRLYRRRHQFIRVASTATTVEDDGVALELLERWRSNLAISRPIRLVATASPIAGPFTFGTWRPLVCVPQRLLGRPHLLEACLAHELAHIRRFDDLRLLCGNALRVIYVLFPPVHWAVARLSWEQERLCDELAVERGKLSRGRYLEAMLQMIEIRQSPAVVPGLSFTKRNLKMRLETLMSRPGSRGQTWLGRTLLWALVIAVLPMAPFAEARTAGPTADAAADPAAEPTADSVSGSAFGTAKPGLVNPLPGQRVTSAFGLRRDPFEGGKKQHTGVDIGVSAGAEVLAAAAGVVESAGLDGDWGQVVVLDHGQGMKTVYAHLDRFLVGAGERVAQGQVIAVPGSSGKSTAPHLHFEVWNEGERVDPASEIAELR